MDEDWEYLKNLIKSALEGDSNDAEHEALWAVAEHFGIHITDSWTTELEED